MPKNINIWLQITFVKEKINTIDINKHDTGWPGELRFKVSPFYKVKVKRFSWKVGKMKNMHV